VFTFGQSILTTVAIQTAQNSFLGYKILLCAFPFQTERAKNKINRVKDL
jgi:hypothetical protein